MHFYFRWNALAAAFLLLWFVFAQSAHHTVPYFNADFVTYPSAGLFFSMMLLVEENSPAHRCEAMDTLKAAVGITAFLCIIGADSAIDHALYAQTQIRQDSISKIKWETFSEGLNQAGLSRKRILVNVCATWCPWCKQMDETVYGDPEIVAYIARKFIAVRLNGEGRDTTEYAGIRMRESTLADTLGTKGYPTSVFLDHTGEFMVKLDGYMNKEIFLKVLQYIGEDAFETKTFTEFAGVSLPRSDGGTSGRRQPDRSAPAVDSAKVVQ